jgi:hypothetical protein
MSNIERGISNVEVRDNPESGVGVGLSVGVCCAHP